MLPRSKLERIVESVSKSSLDPNCRCGESGSQECVNRENSFLMTINLNTTSKCSHPNLRRREWRLIDPRHLSKLPCSSHELQNRFSSWVEQDFYSPFRDTICISALVAGFMTSPRQVGHGLLCGHDACTQGHLMLLQLSTH